MQKNSSWSGKLEKCIDNQTCFSTDLTPRRTTDLKVNKVGLRIMVYIKPWDSTVFENFFKFLKTI